MADTPAIRAVRAIYQHVDDHVRELLPPPPGPEVDSPLMLLQGAIAGIGTFGGTTTTIHVGPGPCPEVPIFGGVVSANYTGGFVLQGRVPAPHGWTDCEVIRSRGADGVAGRAFVAYQFENAAFGPIVGTVDDYATDLYASTSAPFATNNLISDANRDMVRYVSLWGRSYPDAGKPEGTFYNFDVRLSATFSGICDDVEVPVEGPAGPGVISTGVAGIWTFDYKARITGWYLQEFDGTSGSITLNLEKAARGPTPSFASMVASAPPTIASGRYGEDATLAGWDDVINRGDVIRVNVVSVSNFTRLLFGLRIRRLEP